MGGAVEVPGADPSIGCCFSWIAGRFRSHRPLLSAPRKPNHIHIYFHSLGRLPIPHIYLPRKPWQDLREMSYFIQSFAIRWNFLVESRGAHTHCLATHLGLINNLALMPSCCPGFARDRRQHPPRERAQRRPQRPLRGMERLLGPGLGSRYHLNLWVVWPRVPSPGCTLKSHCPRFSQCRKGSNLYSLIFLKDSNSNRFSGGML